MREAHSLEAIQILVAGVWKRLLGVEKISLSDSFFEIGGDSMMMVDMLIEVGSLLETEIDPTLLFTDATLGGFSQLLAGASMCTAGTHTMSA